MTIDQFNSLSIRLMVAAVDSSSANTLIRSYSSKLMGSSAIPGQYFNDINHVVEMIRQKHDVACAEYRLECP